MKKTVIILLYILISIVIAGIYKFNVLNDDIYTTTSSGSVVQLDELEEARDRLEKIAFSYAQTADIYIEDGHNLRLKEPQSLSCDRCFDYVFEHYGDPDVVYDLSVMIDKNGTPSWVNHSTTLSQSALMSDNTPPLSFFAGRYSVIGRHSSDSKNAYHGWAILEEEADHLTIQKCIHGELLVGNMKREATAVGDRSVLKGVLTVSEGTFEMSCLDLIDLDNYPRLTCYTYLEPSPTIVTPGTEVYFPVTGDVAEDDFKCE
jgi:hypothetical protein